MLAFRYVVGDQFENIAVPSEVLADHRLSLSTKTMPGELLMAVGGMPPVVVPEEPVVVVLPSPDVSPLVVVLAAADPLALVVSPAFDELDELAGAAPVARLAMADRRVATAVLTDSSADVPGAAPSMIEEELT